MLRVSRTIFSKQQFAKSIVPKYNFTLATAPFAAPTSMLISRQFSSGNQNESKLQKWAGRSVSLSAIGYGLVKLKFLKVLLPVLKVTKLSSLISMGVSMAAYGYIFGWSFGAGMVGLIFVHELGHGIMMHRLGIPTSPMLFVPFMGAALVMKERPKNAYEEALVAIAGPVVGTAATIPIMVYGLMDGSQFCLALSQWGLMVNLFNLLPVGDLDGGRVTGALSKKMVLVGAAASPLLLYINPYNPVSWLVVLSAGYKAYDRFYGDSAHDHLYYSLTRGQQVAVGGGYLGLIAVIIALMQMNDSVRKSPKQIQREQGIYNNPEFFEWTDENNVFPDQDDDWRKDL